MAHFVDCSVIHSPNHSDETGTTLDSLNAVINKRFLPLQRHESRRGGRISEGTDERKNWGETSKNDHYSLDTGGSSSGVIKTPQRLPCPGQHYSIPQQQFRSVPSLASLHRHTTLLQIVSGDIMRIIIYHFIFNLTRWSCYRNALYVRPSLYSPYT